MKLRYATKGIARGWSHVAIALLLSGGLPTAALAQERATAASATDKARTPARLDGIEAFVDGIIATGIANREVAGAVFVLVADGKVLLSKGYGFADIANQIPVDPAATLFRPGSVSKLLTWTALMQQVEQGKVSLDDPVEQHIDFAIPATFDRPILIRDLLAHTPGFEDGYAGMFSKSMSEFMPLGKFLASRIPGRFWQQGTESSYSNYATALAGYVVERVSGQPFADYIDRHVTGPLGMTRSTFREPLPAGWQAAKSYDFTDGRFVERPSELITNIAPAGSLSATGNDMARFMLAHLGDGALDGNRILRAETARQMRERLFANAPSLPGMAHGFIEYRVAGPRMVGHAGNTGYFHSDLMIAPEAGVGVYVSVTGGDAASIARSELMALVTERMFPTTPLPRWTGAPGAVQEGNYRGNRRSYSTDKVDPRTLISVKRSGDHEVVMVTRDKTIVWEQDGPRLYQQLGNDISTLGPVGKLEFYGEGTDTRFSFERQPYMLYRLEP